MRIFLTLLMLFSLVVLAVQPAHTAAPIPRPLPTVDAHGDALPEGAIARLGTSRFRLGGYGGNMALSPDGKLIATIKYNNRMMVTLIDTTSGREVREIAVDRNSPGQLVFTGDGKELVTFGYDGLAHFYDVVTTKHTRQAKLETQQRSEAYVLSNNGDILVATGRSFGGDKDVPIVIYDTRAQKQIASLTSLHNGQRGASLTPDGKLLATYGSAYFRGGKDNRVEEMKIAQTVQMWNTTTGKETGKIEVGQGNHVAAVAFSPDNKTLALQTSASEVQLWDHTTSKRLKVWRAPQRSGGMGGLSYSPDGKYLVLGGRGSEGAPAVWKVATGERLRTARSPEGFVQGIGFDGDRVIVLGINGQAVVVWDLMSGKRAGSGEGHTGPVNALAFRGGKLITSANDRRLLEWSLTGKPVGSLPEVRQTSRDRMMGYNRSETATFSPNLAYMISGENYGAVTLRDLDSGEELFTMPRMGNDGLQPIFSRDSKLVAMSAYDPTTRKATLRVLRTDSGEEQLTFDPGQLMPGGAAFDPTGKRLAILLNSQGRIDAPNSLLMWRIDQNKEDTTFKKVEIAGGSGYRVHTPVVFSPDGGLLASVVFRGPKNAIHLCDGFSGAEKDWIDVGGTVALTPVFSADGRSLAVATTGPQNNTSLVGVWEMRTRQKRWSAALPSFPTALAFEPSGKVLATGHQDTTALLWDVTGQYRAGKARSREAYEALWKDLASDDASKAFAAQRSLAADADEAVTALRGRVKPAVGKSLGEAALAKLVEQLDDDDPDVRQKAYTTLQEQGKGAEAALKKALEGTPSVQLKRSAGTLLARLSKQAVPPDELASLRAIEVLEWIGTAKARQVVEQVARGWDASEVTRDAKATLARLSEPRTK